MRKEPRQPQYRRRGSKHADELARNLPADEDVTAAPQLRDECGRAEHDQQPDGGGRLAGGQKREG